MRPTQKGLPPGTPKAHLICRSNVCTAHSSEATGRCAIWPQYTPEAGQEYCKRKVLVLKENIERVEQARIRRFPVLYCLFHLRHFA